MGAFVNCANCDKQMWRKEYDLKTFKRHYCSQSCHYEHSRKLNPIGNMLQALGKNRWRSARLRAMFKINPKLECAGCGCNILAVLEINHINGGGGKENTVRLKGAVSGRLARFYDDINNGRRKTDDLNLLCRVCNAAHYAGLKGVSGFVITFNPPEKAQLNTN